MTGRRAFALCFLLGAFPALGASGIEGIWLVEDGDARVEIGPCDQRLCGRVVWLREPHDEQGRERRDTENPDPALRQRRILGLDLLRDIPPEADAKGVFRGGIVYDPKTGKSYRCRLTLVAPDQLKLRGYLGLSILGRTTYWRRVADPGPSALPASDDGG